MKAISVRKYLFLIWFFAFILICVGAYNVWRATVEVKEPIEILSTPPLEFVPDETKEFNVTVWNHASVNYYVTLYLFMDNLTYQNNYVTFISDVYVVAPGKQNLTASLKVSPHAPPRLFRMIF